MNTEESSTGYTAIDFDCDNSVDDDQLEERDQTVQLEEMEQYMLNAEFDDQLEDEDDSDDDDHDDDSSIFTENQQSNALTEGNYNHLFNEEYREQNEERINNWLPDLQDKTSTPKCEESGDSVRNDVCSPARDLTLTAFSNKPVTYFSEVMKVHNGNHLQPTTDETANNVFQIYEEQSNVPEHSNVNTISSSMKENEKMGKFEHELAHHYKSEVTGNSSNNNEDQVLFSDYGLPHFLSSNVGVMGCKQFNSGDESTQLKILYDARGREIKRLNNELYEMKEEYSKEIQMLKHQLIMAQGDVKGNEFSLQQAQEILGDKNAENLSLKAEVETMKIQITSERNAKEEIIRKLQVADMTISSLQKQIDEISQEENFARSKEQYETLIKNLKLNHEKENLSLKTELDKLKHQLYALKDENQMLQHDLQKQEQLYHQLKLEKAETINRLTRSLEASQVQCQKLLESGNPQSISHMKGQIAHLEISKTEAENCLKVLQEEIKSLRSELETYENVSKLGLFGNESTEDMDESAIQLGLRRQKRCHSVEDLTTSLKSELQKSLLNLRSRRNQLLIVQAKLSSTERDTIRLKKQLAIVEEKAENAESKAKELEKQCASHEIHSSTVSSLQKEISGLQKETSSLNEKLMEKNQQIEDLSEIKKQLEDHCAKMKSEMLKSIEEKEEEKQNALKKCFESALQLRQDAVEKFQHETETCFQYEKSKLCQEYEKEIAALKNEIGTLSGKIHEVKEFSIKVCQERDFLENKFEKMDAANIEFRSKLQTQHEEEKLQMQKLLQKNFNEQLIKEKETWEESAYHKFKHYYEQQKHELMEEWNKQKLEEIQNAIQKAKNEYHQELIQLNKKNAVDNMVQTEKIDNEKDKQITLNVLHEKLEREWHNKLETVEKLYTAKIDKLKQDYEQELEETIAKTKAMYCKQKEEALKYCEIEIDHLKHEVRSLEEQLSTMKRLLPLFPGNKEKNGSSLVLNDAAPNKMLKCHPIAEQEKHSQHSALLTEIKILKQDLEKSHEDKNRLQEKLQKYNRNMQSSNKKHKEEISKLTTEFHSVVDNLKTKIAELQIEEMRKTEKEICDLKQKHEQELLELKMSTIRINKKDAFSQTFEELVAKNNVQAWKEDFSKDLKELSEKMKKSLLHSEELSKQRMNEMLRIYHDQLVQYFTNKLLTQDISDKRFHSSLYQYGNQNLGKNVGCSSELITHYLENSKKSEENLNLSSSLYLTAAKDFPTKEHQFSTPTFEQFHSEYAHNKRTREYISNILNKIDCSSISFPSVPGLNRPVQSTLGTFNYTKNRDLGKKDISYHHGSCAERPFCSGTD